MNVNRRFVIKSLALSSIAGVAIGSPVRALAGTIDASADGAAVKPVRALVNQGAAESVFLHGAMAVEPRLQAHRVGIDLGFMLNFEHQLRSNQPMRVIGLLDDTSATLIVDMARSAGARVQWLGQHTAEVGFTRHHLLNTDVAEGCSRQLARQLHLCGAGFSLNEERQNSVMAQRQLAGSSRMGGRTGQWATSIGYLLASLGTRAAMTVPLAPATDMPVTGSFVSFSIDA